MFEPVEIIDGTFRAKVVLASVGPNNIPIFSIEAKYPRFIHAEIMTHRDRARNAASSRAIPWKRKGKTQKRISQMEKGEYVIGKGQFKEISLDENETYDYYVKNCMFSMIMTEPVVPISFGLEQTGMQSGDELTGEKRDEAIKIWLDARNNAVRSADMLAELGVHKSICNRLTEPFMWITTLMTATEWKNFFRLRCHPAAEKHFQKIAGMIREVKNASKPQFLISGEWHMPYLQEDEVEDLKIPGNLKWCDDREIKPVLNSHSYSFLETKVAYYKQISAARCGRLSYLTHDGIRDPKLDIKLCKQLIERDDDVLHASPLEHVNEASSRMDLRSGPMRGWKQFRKEFANENVEG